MASITVYPFDLTASLSSNLSDWEYHALPSRTSRVLFPQRGSFYEDSLQVMVKATADDPYVTLAPRFFGCADLDVELTQRSGKAVYNAIVINADTDYVHCVIRYRYVGASVDSATMLSSYAGIININKTAAWNEMIGRPEEFPVTSNHAHDVRDFHDQAVFKIALNNIAQAITTGDEAQHDLIYSRLSSAIAASSKTLNDLIDSADTTDFVSVNSLVQSANIKLALCEIKFTQVESQIADVRRSLTTIDTFNADISQYVDNPIFSSVLQQVDLLFRVADSRGLSVPNRMGGLACWIDATGNDARVTSAATTVACRATNRSWTSGSAYFEKKVNPDNGVAFLRVKSKASMALSAGAPVQIKNGYTIIAVYAGTSDSSTGFKILMSTTNSQYLRIKDDDQRAFVFGAAAPILQCAVNTCYASKLTMSAMVVDALHEDTSLFVSSKSGNTNAYPLGYEPPAAGSSVDITASNLFDATSASTDSLDLYHFMIFSKRLKPHEIEVLCAWLQERLGCAINLIGNGDLTQATPMFTSDYASSDTLTSNATYDITTSPISDVFPNNTVSQDLEWYTKRRQAVKGSSQTLAFWKQSILVDPYCKYQFDVTLVFTKEAPPIIAIEINGAIKKTYDCTSSASSRVVITTSFETSLPNIQIRLFNKDTTNNACAFMLESVACRRNMMA